MSRLPASLRLRPDPREGSAGWTAALLVAALWAVVPGLPALARGELLGQPFTDLYPSVWGMQAFADALPAFLRHTDRIGAPDGAPFYYASPIHGLVAAPLSALGGPVFAWNATLLLARFATVAVAFGAFRAGGLRPAGALAAAAVYGASPYFHGYAVEGIVEGTDGWALPLWAWAVLRGHRVAAVGAFALTVVASWYLGMVACALALGWGVRTRVAWLSLAGGLLLAAPFVGAFAGAMGGGSPLPDEVRAAMGAPLRIPEPGVLPGQNVFALNTYVGVAVVLLALPSVPVSPALVAGALVCAVLSLGRGPWWDLPVLEHVRFPYRWHAGTLLCLAPMVGRTVDRLRHRWVGALPVLEGLLLSPVEPVLPGAPTEVPAIYDGVRGPILLEVPGPVAMPPGKINRSRPRARYLLFHQLTHGAASPWHLDFNGLAEVPAGGWRETFASWDPLLRAAHLPPDVDGARAAGVTQVMVHRDELAGNARAFEAALVVAGATLLDDDGVRALYAL